MNTLSTKAYFLKLKINSPLASNLFKGANSFLPPFAKLTNLFLLLLKLMLTKFNVPIILQVESYGLICVSANLTMSLFIILLSLTISSTCLGNDLTL